MKIYQIWYDSISKSKLQYPFIPYDNTIPTKPHEFEYGVMRKLYYDDATWKRNDKLGVVSWKFTQKTGIDAPKFHSWVKSNKNFDVYHINPFYVNSRHFQSVWHQGEVCHKGMYKFTFDLFEKAGLDPNLLANNNTPLTTCYCNYWVGSKRFWDVYMSYTEKLYNIIYDCDKEILDKLFYIKADRNIDSGLFSFIFERMFSTILEQHKSEFRILPYYT